MTQISLPAAYRALAALCVGLFLTLTDQAMVAVALPHIARDLNASTNQMVWVVAIYLLTFAVPVLVTGRLGDRLGQRTMYLAGMLLFCRSRSSLCCCANDRGAHCAARPARSWREPCATRNPLR